MFKVYCRRRFDPALEHNIMFYILLFNIMFFLFEKDPESKRSSFASYLICIIWIIFTY